jgi:hypothetical protein
MLNRAQPLTGPSFGGPDDQSVVKKLVAGPNDKRFFGNGTLTRFAERHHQDAFRFGVPALYDIGMKRRRDIGMAMAEQSLVGQQRIAAKL